jgi:hypothetical protein
MGRDRHRWEDNIKMDLREIVYEDVSCTQLAQEPSDHISLSNL